ncbi:MAG: T9SS type A sorting domain-containing protein [Ferruginibacter sp.]
MKDQKKSIIAVILCGLSALVSFTASAQVQTPRYVSMTAYSNAYYEYLPQGYNSTGDNYPVIIFFHGSGENGNGSPAVLPLVLKNGTPKQISQGIFPNYFLCNGDTFRCIVISPQFILSPPPQDINNVIDYVISHYRVDINRIYLTGLSQGGGNAWDYAGNNISYANRVAAIVPICGFSWPDPAKGQIIAAANLPVWATHNNGDPVCPVSYTIGYTDNIDNAPLPPTPLAKRSIFAASGHDAWSHTYDFTFRENGYNVYEWMFRFKRSFTTLPITGLTFNAVKTNNNSIQLSWQTIAENKSRGFEIERSSDGNHFSSISFINSRGTNGNGAVYNYPDAAPVSGKNYYRLKLLDIDGHFTYSPIRFVDISKSSQLTVYPNPVADKLNINTAYNFNNALLQLYDVNGKQIKQATLNGSGTIVVASNELAAGHYSGRITEGTQQWQFTFIKK